MKRKSFSIKKQEIQSIFLSIVNRIGSVKSFFLSNQCLQCIDLLKTSTDQILKHKHKQPLSITKKREIAEVCFKVLLAYSEKHEHNTSQYTSECMVMNRTNADQRR